ncbi:MAG: ribbon-helix-helix protein, CopG family [Chloroflexota bacterium]
MYLTEEEAESLRRAAAETGRSQAELLRDGLHWVLTTAGVEPRQFHSLGKGRGGQVIYSLES